MNKIILGLLATVFLLGMALVLLNNQLKPSGPTAGSAVQQAAPADRLPALPDGIQSLNGDGQASAKLMELPTPPETPAGTQEGTTVRASLPPLEDYVLHAPKTEQPAVQAEAALSEPASLPALAETSTPAERGDAIHAQSAALGAPEAPLLGEQPLLAAKPASEPAAVVTAPAAPAVPAAPLKDDLDPDQPVESTPAPEVKPAPAAEQPKAAEPKAAEAKPAPEAKTAAKPAETKAAPAPAKMDAAKKTRITVFSRETGATVRINLTAPVQDYKQMLLENPYRFFVDLPGDIKDLRAPGVPANPLVTNVRVGRYGSSTRVVVDLKDKPGKCRVILNEDRTRLDIRVDK